jgi:uncharacterized membrane protein
MRLQRSLLLALVLIAASAAVGAWAYRMLPAAAEVAVHFSGRGEANGFGPAWPGLAILPIVGFVVVVLLAFAPRWLGGGEALARSGGAFGILLIGVAAMFLVAEAAIAMRALDPSFDAIRWLFVAVGILFVLIGAVMGRIAPNPIVGIRTPWTMADERVWRRTHHVTGRLTALGGVALAAVASLSADRTDLVVVLVVCIVGPLLAGVVYSRAIAGGAKAGGPNGGD